MDEGITSYPVYKAREKLRPIIENSRGEAWGLSIMFSLFCFYIAFMHATQQLSNGSFLFSYSVAACGIILPLVMLTLEKLCFAMLTESVTQYILGTISRFDMGDAILAGFSFNNARRIVLRFQLSKAVASYNQQCKQAEYSPYPNPYMLHCHRLRWVSYMLLIAFAAFWRDVLRYFASLEQIQGVIGIVLVLILLLGILIAGVRINLLLREAMARAIWRKFLRDDTQTS